MLLHIKTALALWHVHRHFSSVPNQEPQYTINGVSITRTSVLAVHPGERTIAQWSILVDWDLQRSRNYVIVDPLDPSGLLYLNHAEYLAQSRVCASNDLMLIVVARPGSKRPMPIIASSDPTQNSPWGIKIERTWSRDSKLTWRSFLKLRANVARLVNRSKGSAMVTETKDSLVRSVLLWTRTLAHYAEVRKPELYGAYMIPVVHHLQRVLIHNGQMAVVKHLKLSLFILYSYISGNPVKSSIPLGWGIRLRTCGLPRIWDDNLVNQIKQGRIETIRIMASLLNLYRAMEAPHPEFSVSTIVKPHPEFSSEDWTKFQEFCKEVFPNILHQELKAKGHRGPITFKYRTGFGTLITTAGANFSCPSIGSIILDAKAWFNKPVNHVLEWFKLHGDTLMERFFTKISTNSHWGTKESLGSFSRLFMVTKRSFYNVPDGEGNPTAVLGRLHTIDEPAGKVRVVAICDYWTQAALKPVHDHLMELLRRIGTDATFDQVGRTESYFKRGLSPHWSFDLSAATDTIPTALYKEVLRPLLRIEGEDPERTVSRVNLWLAILTDRDFVLPNSSETVRYGTGQPMGALSSWASMAIVHHALVQFSAWKQSEQLVPSWYQDYLVLGDDIDIGRSAKVAEAYQASCQSFHIVIGLLKSLHSTKNCFEFANQRFSPDGNISPLSFKEELQAQTWMGRLEYAKRILARFGTSLKDEASALILKASTAAQWKAVLPERSGVRPSALLTLVRFCLLTPFTNVKEVRLDSVLDWIAPILSQTERKMLIQLLESPTKRLELERTLFDTLRRELLTLANKLLSSVPLPFTGLPAKGERFAQLKQEGKVTDLGGLIYSHPYALGVSSKVCVKRFSETCEGSEPDIFRSKEINNLLKKGGNHPLYTEAAFYLFHCVSLRNNKVVEELKGIVYLLELWGKPTTYKAIWEGHQTDPKNFKNPLENLFRQWGILTSLPSIVQPDFDKAISTWLVKEAEDTPLAQLFHKNSGDYRNRLLQERIRGPMASVSLALVRHLGITIPPIPYHVHRTGGSWVRNLKENLALYNLERTIGINFEFADAISQPNQWVSIVLEESDFLGTVVATAGRVLDQEGDDGTAGRSPVMS